MKLRTIPTRGTRKGLLAATLLVAGAACLQALEPNGTSAPSKTLASDAAAGQPATTATPRGGEPGAVPEANRNFWPVWVQRRPADASRRTQAAGPLLFSTTLATGEHLRGLRPFWVAHDWPDQQRSERSVLYPLFIRRESPGRKSWSVLNLVNHHGPSGSTIAAGDSRGFDLWPFWFSRRSPEPGRSYSALFPVWGDLRGRFLNDRVRWLLFPVWSRWEKDGRATTVAPWPFFRHTSGRGHSGTALWPLFGVRAEAGVFRHRYWAWPLAHHRVDGLDKPEGPTVSRGLLPFWYEQRGPGLDSRIYGWPFFGTTHRTDPSAYDETRWLWPLFVQGRGKGVVRERWAPFYTRSEVNGVSKTWILWPLWRDQTFTERGLDQRKRQVLWVLGWDLRQRNAGAPDGAPEARKTHVWPLFSSWDNGGGRRQFQLLSPIEPLLQHSEAMRQAWSPLFALYRHEAEAAAGSSRHSLLWDAVTLERSRAAATSSFRLGPLFGTDSAPAASRISLLSGLVGLRRSAGSGWKPFLFDFKKRAAKPAATQP